MNSEALKEYYITSFPSKSVYEWLTRKKVILPKQNAKKKRTETVEGEDSDSDSDSELEHLTMSSFNTAANNREIAYEYQSGAYGRYLTFPTFKQFHDRLISTVPNRFEVGAIYENVPKKIENLFGNGKSTGGNNVAIEKEFVFDIDMDDYDPYRTCCSGSQICDSCWSIFIDCAIEILSTILYEYFNWNNFFFVYSGRRGLHLWVMDYEARILNDIERAKVMDFLNICKNRNCEVRLNNSSGTNCLARPLNPFIQDALPVVSKYFNQLLEEQDPFSEIKQTKKILSTQFPAVTTQLNTFYMTNGNNGSSMSKWKAVNDIYLKQQQTKLGRNYNDLKEKNKLLEQKEEVLLKYLYPKFDIEVSKKIGHLLKSPFCIHPGTGNVCVPFHISYQKSIDSEVEVETLSTFKPSTCPNIKTLKQENDFSSYVQLFDKFLENYINLEAERENIIIESKQLKKRKAETNYDW
ncbi:hypothetical protein QEN19_004100 [Hanseniaspora menglaensis]